MYRQWHRKPVKCLSLVIIVILSLVLFVAVNNRLRSRNHRKLNMSSVRTRFERPKPTIRSMVGLFRNINTTAAHAIRNNFLSIFKIENAIQVFHPYIPVKEYDFDLGWRRHNHHKSAVKIPKSQRTYDSPQTAGLSVTNFKTCAIVGNSGILYGSECGEDIDNHDFIIRANMAPLGPFGRDVGVKTDIMSINQEVIRHMLGNLTSDSSGSIDRRDEYQHRLRFLNSSILWYFKSTHNLQSVHQLATIVRNELKLPLRYAFSPKGLGNPTKRLWDLNVPTSGLILYTFSTAICEHISLYGFYPFTKDRLNRPIYNHYYEHTMMDFKTDTNHTYEKEFQILQRLNKKGAVRLITDRCRS